MKRPWSIWLGFDPREAGAFAVARESIRRHLTAPIPIYGVILDDLRTAGLYRRPTGRRLGQLWDDISDAPMATEFAISRFLVRHLARSGLALFMDCDVMARGNLARLFEKAEAEAPAHALWCVKHDHAPAESFKMDHQIQTVYARKNWSSVMMIDCDHPANDGLTVDLINTVPGRDLHRFCWLDDAEIGELGPEWNYLVGHTRANVDPIVVHFTDGIPTMEGFRDVSYADEWHAVLRVWAA